MGRGSQGKGKFRLAPMSEPPMKKVLEDALKDFRQALADRGVLVTCLINPNPLDCMPWQPSSIRISCVTQRLVGEAPALRAPVSQSGPWPLRHSFTAIPPKNF